MGVFVHMCFGVTIKMYVYLVFQCLLSDALIKYSSLTQFLPDSLKQQGFGWSKVYYKRRHARYNFIKFSDVLHLQCMLPEDGKIPPLLKDLVVIPTSQLRRFRRSRFEFEPVERAIGRFDLNFRYRQ